MENAASILSISGLIFEFIGIIAGAAFVLERVFPKTALQIILNAKSFFDEYLMTWRLYSELREESKSIEADLRQRVESKLKDISKRHDRLQIILAKPEKITEDMVKETNKEVEILRVELAALQRYMENTELRTGDFKARAEEARKRFDELKNLWLKLIIGQGVSGNAPSDESIADSLVNELRKPSSIASAFFLCLLVILLIVYGPVNLIIELISAFALNIRVPWFD